MSDWWNRRKQKNDDYNECWRADQHQYQPSHSNASKPRFKQNQKRRLKHYDNNGDHDNHINTNKNYNINLKHEYDDNDDDEDDEDDDIKECKPWNKKTKDFHTKSGHKASILFDDNIHENKHCYFTQRYKNKYNSNNKGIKRTLNDRFDDNGYKEYDNKQYKKRKLNDISNNENIIEINGRKYVMSSSNLGAGSYGEVKAATDTTTTEKVAIKFVIINNKYKKSIMRELKYLRDFKHENIINLIDDGEWYDNEKGVNYKCFILKYYTTDLYQLIIKKKYKFKENEIKFVMLQILKAVKYLHDNNILHRDIKTKNILIDTNGHVVLCDFGISCDFDKHPKCIQTPLVQSLWYRAPELLLSALGRNGIKYSFEIDLWSIGCIFGEILQNKVLFKGNNEIETITSICNLLGRPPKNQNYIKYETQQWLENSFKDKENIINKEFVMHSMRCIDLLQLLLSYHPKQRINIDDALKHNYFKQTPLPSINKIL